MKKYSLFLLYLLSFTLFIIPIKAQEYDISRLRMIADIWGEVYLFHPSIVRADKNIPWEQELVSFLPSIKGKITEDEFAQIVNKKLLSALGDRFTRLQKRAEKTSYFPDTFPDSKEFDYIQLSESLLSDISHLIVIDSMITDHN